MTHKKRKNSKPHTIDIEHSKQGYHPVDNASGGSKVNGADAHKASRSHSVLPSNSGARTTLTQPRHK